MPQDLRAAELWTAHFMLLYQFSSCFFKRKGNLIMLSRNHCTYSFKTAKVQRKIYSFWSNLFINVSVKLKVSAKWKLRCPTWVNTFHKKIHTRSIVVMKQMLGKITRCSVSFVPMHDNQIGHIDQYSQAYLICIASFPYGPEPLMCIKGAKMGISAKDY